MLNYTSTSKYRLERVLIIGLGLIGGSLAKALKTRSCVGEVVGADRNLDECRLGLQLGVIDRVAEDLAAEVSRADLIVLAVPVKAMETVLEMIRPHLKLQTLVTDVGSTKGNLVQAARRIFGHLPATFIPGHPIAGAEKSGVRASDADLFEHHKVILTPLPETDPNATLELARLWQAVGAEVLQMEVGRHDEVLAATSHLPHLLAFSLVDTLAREEENLDIFRYAAGGFRDFTRIAASDPTMWHDICIANRDAILAQIDRYTQGVARLRRAIDQGDSEGMLGIFTRAKAARDHFTRLLNKASYSSNDHTRAVNLRARGGARLNGEFSLPGDKSISHRAIILAAIAEGVTDINGFLENEDSLATLQALRDMGVVIEGPHQGQVRVFGVGLNGLKPPPGPLYLGHSATAMRLLAGVLAAQSFDTELFGDEALCLRDMTRVAEPLRQMGALIETGEKGGAPLRIKGGQQLRGIDYCLPVPSAQIKSSLLLASLWAEGETCIRETVATRDHTERMLAAMGADIERTDAGIRLVPGDSLKATNIDVPGDMSWATLFMLAAGSEHSCGRYRLRAVGINPSRIGALVLLQQMGAGITLEHRREQLGEPVADLVIEAGQRLKGIDADAELLAPALDELPLLLVAAAVAEGESRFSGLARLKHKEDDPVHKTVTLLVELGAAVEQDEDSIRITGGSLRAGSVDAKGSLRVAMALLAAGLCSVETITVTQSGTLLAAYPDFVEQAQRVGLNVHKEED
ncbi:bifunctional prephenate dehydrogenase/3-phosphoshikimate 1-carboxyvinyltransferase [Marinobacterium sediminicola]|uniref:3-phosphoshikimate 1-carboxyvinyltransferase n=1 Tax=Marinobacterium sediminicola TaxID=518898 RepID=A0ABY1RZW1_9GAMM|nr:bifunctional prephenate dehydrogenase/3-phosphoshikimate 1-carboxyvinyltransferase [Marinobacterium sediminicola]ULG70032.1 bifunctional prephenate dehydrogenase/3-phosphoshikimate 1-carboxyvinyltransferase [Marinobacterium sediminicola]SMR74486.1 3-phosphoshikimate 1-carboxyvinyltransferase [Marinobacterium sediminicola]